MSTVHANIGLVTETCCYKECGVMFAFTQQYYNIVRDDPNRWWHCPNGHSQHYEKPRESADAQEVRRQAKVRESALQDQLSAAVRDAELARQALLKDRSRISKGVCPCCTRSFQDLRRHMSGQHPEYANTVEVIEVLDFKCLCGRAFATLQGLRIHQTRQRTSDWDQPGVASWRSHLTDVSS